MSAPDYPDFTVPTSPVELASVPAGSPFTMAPSSQTGPIDTSGAASIALDLGLPVGAAGDRCALVLTWYVSGLAVDTEVLTFHSSASYGGTTTNLFLQTPARATSLRLTYYTTGLGSLTVYVVMSTRAIGETRLTRQGSILGRQLASVGATVPASGSSTFYLPPARSLVSIDAGFGIASGFVAVNGVSLTNAPAVTVTRMTVVTTNANLGGVLPNVSSVLTGMEVVVQNSDTGAHAGTLWAWDVS